MSLSDVTQKAKVWFAVVPLALALTGCIRPVYSSLDGRLQSEMQAIQVTPVSDTFGHYLTKELIFALNGTGSSVSPKYILTLVQHRSFQSPIVDTFSHRATAETMFISVDYVLTPIGSTQPIATGTVTNAVTYDRSQQRYADVRAERNADIDNARTLADEIRTRISISLASQTK